MFYYKKNNQQRYVALRRKEVSRGAVDYHHAPARQRELVRELAEEIIRARRVVVLTGAGISTGSGLRDQSSGLNCSKEVKAGPGRSAVQTELKSIYYMQSGVHKTNKRIELASRLAMSSNHVGSPTEAIPSTAHMALVNLQRAGLVHHIISTNTDGLHWRSGIPPEQLTTLQGNPYTEACGDCGHQYLRDYMVRKTLPRKFKRPRGSHETGRYCTHPDCHGFEMGGGRLYDNMVLPKEAIEPHTMRRAFVEIHQADLFLVLGSSLREEPALVCVNRALKYGRKGTNSQFKYVCMVTLQQTMHDDAVDLRVHSDVNLFLSQLCAEVDAGSPIPYQVRLRVKIGVVYCKDERTSLEEMIKSHLVVEGAELPPHPNGEVFVQVEEQNGLPLTCVSSLNVRLPHEYAYYGSRIMSTCVNKQSLMGEDWDGRVRCVIDPMAHAGWAQVCVTLRQPGPVMTNMMHKPLYFSYWLDTTKEGESITSYELEFDPRKGEWSEEPLSIVEEGDKIGHYPVDPFTGLSVEDRGGSAYTSSSEGGGSAIGAIGGGTSSHGSRGSRGSRVAIWSREKPADFNMQEGLAGGSDMRGISAASSITRGVIDTGNGNNRGHLTAGGSSLGSSGSNRLGTGGSKGGAMVTFGMLPATRVGTADLNSGKMQGMFPPSFGSGSLGSLGSIVGAGGSRVGTAESMAHPVGTPPPRSKRGKGIRNAGTSEYGEFSNRRVSSPAMEGLIERAHTSPLVEELVHRLNQPSMISGSDLPMRKVPLSGGESILTEARPASESMSKRNHQARLDALMAGRKVSKERRHSVVEGKGRSLVKPQGFRRVATAIPMTKKTTNTVVVDNQVDTVKPGKRMEEVNYCGYSTQ